MKLISFTGSYHKYNLFGIELEHLQKPAPHLSAFRTDFGAVIGLMTCFDVLFELPGVEMTRRGVTHFAFPTDWSDELPSLSGRWQGGGGSLVGWVKGKRANHAASL